ncbi:MAG TPA: hypothetical protein VN894_17345 [Polyangiaceae bacterium]|nr:hypothetical protein [Polyangiaceae bacterium]
MNTRSRSFVRPKSQPRFVLNRGSGSFFPGAVSLAFAFVTLAPAMARAMDPEVTSDTAAQFYDVRSPTGESVLSRRRFTTTLGLSAYDLLKTPPGDPKAPDMSLRVRLRYDADFGAPSNVTDPTAATTFVPGFSQGLVDVMYAYLEGRRFLKGWLGFRLGRQYMVDALGWWSFDGGEVNVTTPYFVKAEAYGGLEQRGGMPLSTSRFEADGIWTGNRSGFDKSLYTSFQQVTLGPAFGAALESTGVTWIHGRLTYRRVYNTGQSNVSEYGSGVYTPAVYDGLRIGSDRLGYAMDAAWSGVGGAKGGVVYDFYRSEVTHAYGSIDGYLGRKVTVSADYDYYVPSFDGDSIFNFFAGEPLNDAGLRANVDFSDHLSVAGGAQVRVFDVQTAPFAPGGGAYAPSPNYSPAATYFPTNGHPFNDGGYLHARWRTGETKIALRGAADIGDEGQRVGADLSGEHVFETRYVVSGRAGVWQWKDELRPDRDATTVNYVAAVGYRFGPRAQAMVDWEHDFNRLVGQRFRLMLLLTLATTK